MCGFLICAHQLNAIIIIWMPYVCCFLLCREYLHGKNSWAIIFYWIILLFFSLHDFHVYVGWFIQSKTNEVNLIGFSLQDGLRQNSSFFFFFSLFRSTRYDDKWQGDEYGNNIISITREAAEEGEEKTTFPMCIRLNTYIHTHAILFRNLITCYIATKATLAPSYTITIIYIQYTHCMTYVRTCIKYKYKCLQSF